MIAVQTARTVPRASQLKQALSGCRCVCMHELCRLGMTCVCGGGGGGGKEGGRERGREGGGGRGMHLYVFVCVWSCDRNGSCDFDGSLS